LSCVAQCENRTELRCRAGSNTSSSVHHRRNAAIGSRRRLERSALAVLVDAVLDGLGDGVQYWQAYTQNLLCMPSRSTMLTGQYPRAQGA